jgi:hypothetical protein
VSSEVLDKLMRLVTAAFGLVAALAWNTAIQALFTLVLPEAETSSRSPLRHHCHGDRGLRYHPLWPARGADEGAGAGAAGSAAGVPPAT